MRFAPLLFLPLLAAAPVVPPPLADKPVVAPAEAWVAPVALPADPLPIGNGQSRLLLRDEQVRFELGATTTYREVAIRVLSPEGLGPVGNVRLNWNPETDRLVIHRLRILRGTAVIDELAGGQQPFTVLRREANLERAAIDGVLTASLQIAGLQVGDIADLSYSIRHADPITAGHHEWMTTLPADAGSVHLSASWPSTMPIRWRQTDDLPKAQLATRGGETVLTLSAARLPTPVLPRGAPARFQQAYKVNFTDYPDWAGVAALMAPLYARAATVPADGAVAKEAARIAALSPDPVRRAEAALALVETQVRYFYVGLNDGGYLPADAETTWTRRFGDCKAKTVLLLSLLRQLGVAAEPVVVQTSAAGDAVPSFLPKAGLFNHILVRATIAGRTYWLDGTRLGDRQLADLRVPPFHWGLPIVASGAALVPITPVPLTRPDQDVTLRIDASHGIAGPVPVTGTMILRGDTALSINRLFTSVPADARTRAGKDFWRRLFDFVEPSSATASFDPATGEEHLTLAGTATLDWSDRQWEIEGMKVGYAADLHRDPGPHADAPFAVGFPAAQRRRLELVLPDGGRGFALDPVAYDGTLAGTHTHRDGRITDGVLAIEQTRVAVAPEFPASEAGADEASLRHLAREHLYLHAPATAVTATGAGKAAG